MVAACRGLDYPAIVAHSPEAVAQLRQVATALNLDLGRLRADASEALAAYARAQPPQAERPVVVAEADSERRRRCVEVLTKAGLGSGSASFTAVMPRNGWCPSRRLRIGVG